MTQAKYGSKIAKLFATYFIAYQSSGCIEIVLPIKGTKDNVRITIDTKDRSVLGVDTSNRKL